jgi:hypothetical protein
MSRGEGNLEAGIDVDKLLFEAAIEETRLTQFSAVNPNTPFNWDLQKPDGSVTEEQAKSLQTYGVQLASKEPGVRVVILLIHAMDSAIMTDAIMDHDVFNIHDAIGAGVEQITEAAKQLNMSTFEYLRDYHVPLEIIAALHKQFANRQLLIDMKEPNGEPTFPGLEEALNEVTVRTTDKKRAFNEYDNQDPVNEELLDTLMKDALTQTINKLEMLLTVDYLNQYGFEGAHYEVTAADRAIIKSKLSNFRKSRKEVYGRIDAREAERNKARDKKVKEDKARAKKAAKDSDKNQELLAEIEKHVSKLTYYKGQENYITGPKGKVRILSTFTVNGVVFATAAAEQFGGPKNKVVLIHAASGEAVSDLESTEKKIKVYTNSKQARESIGRPSEEKTTVREAQEDIDFYSRVIPVWALGKNDGVISNPEFYIPNSGPSNGFGDLYIEPNRNRTVGTSVAESINQEALMAIWDQATIDLVASNDPNQEISVTFSQMVPHLRRAIETTDSRYDKNVSFELSTHRNFLLEVLTQLETSLDPDMDIVLLTRDSVGEISEQHLLGAGAWYDPRNNTVYMRSPDFVNNNFTPGVLVHELLHALSFNVIDKWEKVKTAPQGEQDLKHWQAVQNLIAVRDQVKASSVYQDMSPRSKARVDYALTNIDELMSDGLSHGPVMDLLRRVEVTVPFNNDGDKKVSALTAIGNFLYEMIWGDRVKSPALTNGLDVLITSFETMVGAAQIERSGDSDTNTRTYPAPRGAQAAPAGSSVPPNQASKTQPKDYLTREIFEGLGIDVRVPGAMHQKRLAGLLSKIVDTVYRGNERLRKDLLEAAPDTTDATFFETLYTGKRPFVSNIVTPLRITNQEAFTIEALDLVLQTALESSPQQYQEVSKMFQEIRNNVNESDLPPGAYDVIFNKGPDVKGHVFLSQFMAAALAYEPLVTVLNNLDPSESNPSFKETWKAKGFTAAIDALWSKIVTALSQADFSRNKSAKWSKQLELMAESLARVERREQSRLRSTAGNAGKQLNSFTEAADLKFKKIVDKLRDAVSATARKGKEKTNVPDKELTSKKTLKRALNTIFRVGEKATDSKTKTEDVVQALQDQQSESNEGRQTFLGELLTEALGETDLNAVSYQLTVEQSMNEQAVLKEMLQIQKFVEELWDTPLTKEQSESVTAMLRVDLAGLFQAGFDINQIRDLLTNKAALDTAIQSKVKVISDEINKLVAAETLTKKEGREAKNFLINQTTALGLNLATGASGSDLLAGNSYQIANFWGSHLQRKFRDINTDVLDAAVDDMAAMYGIEYSRNSDKAMLADIIKDEASRSDALPNAVESILILQEGFKKKSLEDDFDGSPVHMRKGYTKEIYDPRNDIRMATAEEGKDLIAAGYKLVSQEGISRDPVDGTEPRGVYSIRSGGMSTAIAGYIGTRNQVSKGTDAKSLLDEDLWTDPNFNIYGEIAKITSFKQAGIRRLHDRLIDPREQKGTSFVPTYNQVGDIVEWRYMMNNETKDNVLDRENRVEMVMAGMFGSQIGKKRESLTSKKGIDMFKDVYDAEYARSPNKFIEFGPNSEDPFVRERYRLMPAKTKAYMKQVWGTDTILIRKDMFTHAFGYRKAMISGLLSKDKDDLNGFQKNLLVPMLVNLSKLLPGGVAKQDWNFFNTNEQAEMKLFKAERFWQEVVLLIKDARVIKSIPTLVGNEFSNFTRLILSGVYPIEQYKQRANAWRFTEAYRKDENDLRQLELKQATGSLTPAQATKVADEIVIIKDRMSDNPIVTLMENGMYQTLVEDVSQEEDPYGWKSGLDEWAASKTKWIPKPVKTVGKNILMTHESGAYKFMNRATVMSDFTARYALYNSLMKDSNPKDAGYDRTKELAIRATRAAFVNYDVGTSRELQYLNDSGILMFSKYYIRILLPLFAAMRQSPGKAFLVYLLGEVADQPTILEGHPINDPLPGTLSSGVFEFPDAVLNTAVIEAIQDIID